MDGVEDEDMSGDSTGSSGSSSGSGGDDLAMWEPLSFPDFALLGMTISHQVVILCTVVHLARQRQWPPYVTKNVTLVSGRAARPCSAMSLPCVCGGWGGSLHSFATTVATVLVCF